ncbi:MAG TPA: hypothetical protein PLV56_08000, partial [Synergistales bacterium]|nr:hypothetical protein [Synergistales bacterium]
FESLLFMIIRIVKNGYFCQLEPFAATMKETWKCRLRYVGYGSGVVYSGSEGEIKVELRN